MAFACGTGGREGEEEDIGAAGHFLLADGPVHRFCGAPGDAEFVAYGAPEVGFESGDGKEA